jgi:hypothetical protein
VAAALGSPGVLMRIAVVAPPAPLALAIPIRKATADSGDM